MNEVLYITRAEGIDDQGRVLIGGIPRRFWGVDLPRGMTCGSAAGPVPCEKITVEKLRFLLGSTYGEWSPVNAAEPTVYSRLIDSLVMRGWLVDRPEESKGFYAHSEKVARATRQGIWQLQK